MIIRKVIMIIIINIPMIIRDDNDKHNNDNNLNYDEMMTKRIMMIY